MKLFPSFLLIGTAQVLGLDTTGARLPGRRSSVAAAVSAAVQAPPARLPRKLRTVCQTSRRAGTPAQCDTPA